jgi:hypothetical protein
MGYSTPPSFAAGEHLSAYKLRLLAANDDHFNGVADAVNMAPATMGRSWIGTETELIVWDGYLYLTQDTVKFALYLSANDDGQHIHLWFDYGGAHAAEMCAAWATAGEQALQTFDASSDGDYPKNALYRVTAIMHRDTSGTATGELRKCYEIYTGALTFGAPDTFTDGAVSSAANLQELADNDVYFRAIESENHPCVGMTHNVAESTTQIVWTGWVKHKHDRVLYRLQMAGTVGWTFGGTLTLTYGYGDALAETVATVNTETTTEGTHTLVNAFVAGAWYQVTARVTTGAGVSCAATVHYVEEGAAAPDAGFTPIGEFMPGQLVWGTTANMRTRLALLADNDANLNGRLYLMNHAVKKALYLELGGDIGGTYAIRRRKNVLYYRGKNLTMTWGTANSASLNDYDGSHPYWTLDLGAVNGLVAGQVYTISSSSSEAEFAQEREA